MHDSEAPKHFWFAAAALRHHIELVGPPLG